jgi:hypothetical protein
MKTTCCSPFPLDNGTIRKTCPANPPDKMTCPEDEEVTITSRDEDDEGTSSCERS